MNSNTLSCWSSSMVLLLLVAGQQANAMKTCQKEVNLLRLLERVQPQNYALHLILNPGLNTFSGKVAIDLNIQAMDSDLTLLHKTNGENLSPLVRDPRNIILNAEYLTVYNPEFQQGGYSPGVADICHDESSKILVVTLNQVPSMGSDARLTLSFQGEVKSEAKGLFRSSIDSSQALVTHLKSIYARRLFPCFDEPQFKATFDLTIQHPYGTIALSNTPPTEDRRFVGTDVITSFERTRKMSSYLLSLAVGDLRRTRQTSEISGTEIAIAAPGRMIKKAEFMLKKAVQAYDKVLKFFSNCREPLSKVLRNYNKANGLRVNLPQPLKKIDIVAVSTDQGAMENAGLITMRWDLLLTNEKLAKPDDWNYAIVTLTNDMVRLWLGYLVTVSWWDDLWLTEGLADYLASELTNELHPQISNGLYTLISTTVSAMDNDDSRNPHPIKNVNLRTADDILASYNSFTRKKSEAIFRMFANFLGKGRFNSAIGQFVRQYVWGSVESNNWWAVLAEIASSKYCSMIYSANEWFLQAGYPIIIISKIRDGDLTVKQESSLRNGQIWSVPIAFRYRSPILDHMTESETLVLSESGPVKHELSTKLYLTGRYSWLKLNSDYLGYYRVVYNYQPLVKALVRAAPRDFGPADRMQLLSDLYAAGKRDNSMKEFDELLESLKNEEEDGVILLMVRLLTELHNNKDRNSILASSEHVKYLMREYYIRNGGEGREANSDMLKQYTQSRVLDYLVNILENLPNYS